jgi:hypothetical protein
MRAIRLFRLLRATRDGALWRRPVLAEELGVDEDALVGDLEALRRRGCLIDEETDEGGSVWIRVVDDHLRVAKGRAEELRAMWITLALVMPRVAYANA